MSMDPGTTAPGGAIDPSQVPPPLRRGMKDNFSDKRTRKLLVIAAVVAVAGVAVARQNLHSGGNVELPPPPAMTPGGRADGESPRMKQLMQQNAEEEADRASKVSGGSAVPTIGALKPLDQAGDSRRPNNADIKVAAVPQVDPANTVNPASERTSLKREEMKVLLEGWKASAAAPSVVTYIDAGKARAATQAAAQQAAVQAASQASQGEMMVDVGETAFARVMVSNVSTTQTPVIVELLSGPLKGGVLSGSATQVESEFVLQFDQLRFRGQTIAVKAWAISPENARAFVATSYDPQIFTRYVLPMAAGFIEGMTTALSRPKQDQAVTATGTVTTSQGKASMDEAVAAGVSNGVRVISSDLQRKASEAKGIVYLDANEEIGVVFANPVYVK